MIFWLVEMELYRDELPGGTTRGMLMEGFEYERDGEPEGRVVGAGAGAGPEEA